MYEEMRGRVLVGVAPDRQLGAGLVALVAEVHLVEGLCRSINAIKYQDVAAGPLGEGRGRCGHQQGRRCAPQLEGTTYYVIDSTTLIKE